MDLEVPDVKAYIARLIIVNSVIGFSNWRNWFGVRRCVRE